MAVAVAMVLVTWSVALVIVVALGLLPVAAGSSGPLGWRALVRTSWWGLTVLAVVVTAASLLGPLRSPAMGVGLVVLAGGLGAVGGRAASRRGWRLAWQWSRSSALVVGALALAVLYLALAATGPVTNYDSGLYHLGAIRYASEHAAIPGIANLYGPLAYATAQFPLAAVLGNGPLQDGGFRALNGFVLVLAVVDLAVRVTRRRRGPGSYVLATGMVVVLVPMTALADYWVTSPTQDSAVFALTVVATAALADAVSRRRWVPDAGVAGAVSVMLVLIRPTMAVFALAMWAVLAVIAVRRGGGSRLGRSAVAVVTLAVAGGVATAARDRVLSGWLQYPLSLMSFDVPWQAADPTPLREATLGFARDPADPWGAVDGFAWVGAWVGRLTGQWEAYLLGLLVLAAVACLVVAAAVADLRWRALALALIPSATATAVWWLASPPAFRFAWGPLFTLATIPIGWSLWRIGRTGRGWAWRLVAVGAVIPLVAVVAYSTVARVDWAAPRVEVAWGPIPFTLASVPSAPTEDRVLDSGVAVTVPVESDQCWTVYPLCTPDPAPGLRLRGADWQEGFLP